MNGSDIIYIMGIAAIGVLCFVISVPLLRWALRINQIVKLLEEIKTNTAKAYTYVADSQVKDFRGK